MQHAEGVSRRQRIGDPDADLSDLLFAGPVLGLEPLRQGPPRAQLHDEVGPVVGQDAGVVRRDDGRVVGQSAGCGGLLEEAAAVTFILQPPPVHLDRNQAVQRQLPRLPDQGKAPASERPPLTQPLNIWMIHHHPPAPRSPSSIDQAEHCRGTGGRLWPGS
jgi:hypothetical protein